MAILVVQDKLDNQDNWVHLVQLDSRVRKGRQVQLGALAFRDPSDKLGLLVRLDSLVLRA